MPRSVHQTHGPDPATDSDGTSLAGNVAWSIITPAMSLSLRLSLLLAALFLGLAVIGGWGLLRLSDGLRLALAESASDAGRRVLRVLSERIEHRRVESVGSDGQRHTELRVIVNGRELDPAELAAQEAGQAPLRIPPDPADPPLPPGTPASTQVEVRALALAGREPGLWVAANGVGQTIPLAQGGLERELRGFTTRLAWGLAALLAVGLALGIWLAHRIAQPLRALAAGAARLGAGETGVRVADGGVREVRESIVAFNRMAAELERLDAEAQRLRGQQALAERGEIGRGLAHSLRNPLHALGLCIEALQAEAPGSDASAALARAAREQIARLDGSLRGFLALAAGADAPARPVPLREVVEDVLLEARQSFGSRLDLVAEGDLDASLAAVAVELRILLHTLVSNAAEASPEDGVVRVRVSAGDPLRIEVEDEGSGVPEALRPRLFQPHVSSKPQGAGMGLYLAQRLAALRYRGGIELVERAGGGTLARLSLHPRHSA